MMGLFKKTKNSDFQKKFDFDNISFEKEFVFVHVPKNAGTTVYKNVGIIKSQHYTVSEYIEMIGMENYSHLFSFAFVRNPFSRFISLYNYARMKESYYHSSINPEKALYGKHLDFDLLENATVDQAAEFLIEGKLVHNPPHVQWSPQVNWLKDKTGKLNVKYLGRVEDLDFHMRNIYELIGLHYKQKISHLNASSDHPDNYKQLIGARTRDILEEYYKEDLENFNYEF